MNARSLVRVQAGVFDTAALSSRLTEGRTGVGALVAFTGLCRDEQGTLAALEIEHYPGMAEAEIARVVEEAEARWPLAGMIVVHRYGRILPGEPIVLAIAASRHREAAFEAAHFLMDYLKTRAPFWKKEHLIQDATQGRDPDWVSAKESDEAAARRWGDA